MEIREVYTVVTVALSLFVELQFGSHRCACICVQCVRVACVCAESEYALFTAPSQRHWMRVCVCVLVTHVRDTASEMYKVDASVRCVRVKAKEQYNGMGESHGRTERDACMQPFADLTFDGAGNFTRVQVKAEYLNRFRETFWNWNAISSRMSISTSNSAIERENKCSDISLFLSAAIF